MFFLLEDEQTCLFDFQLTNLIINDFQMFDEIITIFKRKKKTN